jgi:hypothetical protein
MPTTSTIDESFACTHAAGWSVGGVRAGRPGGTAAFPQATEEGSPRELHLS